ncbi:hypothetical protein [Paraburkholderia sp. J63]|uniref:hypothetical protein n=1 Tax=Paraburkholderia sp. J63 TaxID=2805434 RepID=UPI002ABE759C|nr:hypothetical protein [Paraburkholderia sp. J63]
MPFAADIDLVRKTAKTSATRRHPIYSTPALDFVALSHTSPAPFRQALPAPGELYLWRYRAEWQAILNDNPRLCISKAEYQWAKHYPNSALAKRYLVGCAAVRLALAPMLACPPGELEFGSTREGSLKLLNPGAAAGLHIHMAFTSLWVIIAVGTTPVGIGSAMPAPGIAETTAFAPRALDRRIVMEQSPLAGHAGEPHWQARHASLCALTGRTTSEMDPTFLRQPGAATTAQTNDGKRYHVLDLPMPGRICSAIALAEPAWTVYASGWLRN